MNTQLNSSRKNLPLLKLSYNVPSYEKVKSDKNLKEANARFEVVSYNQIIKRKDIAWVSIKGGYQKDVTKLVESEKLLKFVNGELITSEVFYKIIHSGYGVTKICHEFHYDLVSCIEKSEICEKLTQSEVYSNTDCNDGIEERTCSACFGSLFLHEKIDKKPEPLEKSDLNSWYTESKPINILSWGAGTDSTLLIIKYGYDVDEIIMCDTGAEEIETYEYIKYFIERLPYLIREKITIIKNDHLGSIQDWHYAKKMIPMPFANRQCTDKFKLRVMHNYIRRTYGTKAVFNMMVGINYDEQVERERTLPTDVQLQFHIEEVLKYTTKDLVKLAGRQKISVEDYKEKLRNALQTGSFKKDGTFKAGHQYARNVYPLCEDKIGKEQEKEVFKENGLIVPPKSGCYFCPMKSKSEFKRLEKENPEQYENVLILQEHSKSKTINIIDQKEQKGSQMRCSCSNGIYEEDEESKRYETKLVNRGI